MLLLVLPIPSLHHLLARRAKQTKKKPTSREEAGKARGEEVAPAAAMGTDLGFEETELRLGLPGGGGGEVGAEGRSSSSSGKRGFAETIDLKLKLPTAGMEEAAAAAKREPAAEKAKRPAEAPAADAEKPPAPKYVYICKHVDLSVTDLPWLKLTASSSISYRLTVAI